MKRIETKMVFEKGDGVVTAGVLAEALAELPKEAELRVTTYLNGQIRDLKVVVTVDPRGSSAPQPF